MTAWQGPHWLKVQPEWYLGGAEPFVRVAGIELAAQGGYVQRHGAQRMRAVHQHCRSACSGEAQWITVPMHVLWQQGTHEKEGQVCQDVYGNDATQQPLLCMLPSPSFCKDTQTSTNKSARYMDCALTNTRDM